MVKIFGLTALCGIMAAGMFGFYMCTVLEKRSGISHRRRMLLWETGIPVFVGIAFLFMQSYGYSFWKTERYLILLYALPVIACIDHKEKKIPNRLLVVLGSVRCVILAGEILAYTVFWKEFFLHALSGAAGSFLLMMVAYYISRKAVGLGDVKLFTITGLYLGFSLNYLVLFLSLFYAAVYALWNMARKKLTVKDEIAFGPFVSAGLWTLLLLGF